MDRQKDRTMHPPDDTEADSDPNPAVIESAPESVFNGRIALVTGGGSGIGAAACRLLGRCAAKVIVADIDIDKARSVASEIDGQAIALDVADPPSWDALNLENPPTIVLLNAGVYSHPTLPYEIHEVTRAEVTRTVGANFLGVLHGLRRLTPAIRAAGGARICLVSSLAGLGPSTVDPLYAATKHAVIGLGRSVAPGLGESDVRVTMLCPSGVDTPLLTEHDKDYARGLFGSLLSAEAAAQAALDLLEFGEPGEIREITPAGPRRVTIELRYEDVDPGWVPPA